MNESSDGCRSFGNGSGSALRTVDVMGAGSPCARADRTPASSISADIARYSSGGKRTICSRVHTDTPPGTNPRIPRGCCIEVSTRRRGIRCTAGGMHAGSDAGGGDRPAAERRRGCLAADPPMGGLRAMPPRVCAAECTNGREESAVDSTAAERTDVKLFRERHFGGARGGRMTTVWRPRVRIPVPGIDGADVDEKRGDELTTKGTKRKRAPPTKGPCEHGVKYRSQCKVCSACPHGRRRSQCKECGGSGICEHGRQRYFCKSCGGGAYCEHGRQRRRCKECGSNKLHR